MATIPENVQVRLNEGLGMNKIQRSSLWLAIYSDVIQITYHPTGEQYHDIVLALFKQWPHLSPAGHESDAMYTVKTQLRDFFGNMRVRVDREIPAVKEKLERYSRKRKSVNFIDTTGNVWGVKNFSPELGLLIRT